MKDILNNYLTIEDVDFALFINGKWGSGKTYFIKNELEKILKPHNLKFFYLTVNGISNSFELHELVTSKCLSNYFIPKKIPWFGNQKNRVTTIIKSISSVSNLIKALKFSDFHFPDETILVLDDIERISPNYNYDEFLGYVNREFIEHNNFKVILIGDASQERIKKSNFSKIREKYIRWVINFKSDEKDIVNSFIQTHSNETNYYNHLTNNVGLLNKLVNRFEIRNYRTLKFFFDVYKVVFNETPTEFEDLYEDIFYFTLVISNEYRNGNLELFDNTAQLPSIVSQIHEKQQLLFFNNDTRMTEDKSVSSADEDKIKSFEHNFERYAFSNHEMMSDSRISYHFNKPIYEFITTGEWDKVEYNEVLKRLMKAKQPVTTKEPNANINTLGNFWHQSENEIDDATDKVIEEIKNGELEFSDFCRVFNILIYLSQQKILKYDDNKIKKMLEEQTKLLNLNFEEQEKYADYFHFGIEIREIEKFSKVSAQALKEKFEAYRKEVGTNDAIKKLESWKENIKEKDNYHNYRVIIENCSSEQIVKKIIDEIKDRDFIISVTRIIKEEYSAMNAGDHYYLHISKLEKIQELLNINDWGELDRVDKYFVDDLIRQINESIEHIEKTKSR